MMCYSVNGRVRRQTGLVRLDDVVKERVIVIRGLEAAESLTVHLHCRY